MVKYQFFDENEFKRANPACSLYDMNVEFMLKLDLARFRAGIPFVINSAYRTKEYELSKGRSGASSHCKGVAVDIACSNSANRARIVAAAIRTGIFRIGIGKNFIHLDCDPTKANAIWLY